MISKDTIQQILDAADIVSVVSDFVTLKKQGSGYIAPCPFHGEKTASFHVSATKNVYKCFGCGKGGNNAVSFIMEHEKYSYPEALRYLANKFSIPIQEEAQSPQKQQQLNLREEIFLTNDKAQQAFIEQLAAQPQAMAYLLDRGLSSQSIAKFRLGYAPEDYDWLYKQLLGEHFSQKSIYQADLAYERQGRPMDKFRSRIIFPIHNVAGKVQGFGGRITDAASKMPKYLNSAETEAYQKRDSLYGLYFAKKAIATLGECNLVEGYLDVISMHQAGLENTVGSSGTALTQNQLKAIGRYSNKINILYDGDPAGLKAAVRGLEIALSEGMQVRVVTFPIGEDPDSYLRKHGPQALRKFLEAGKKDLIDFLLQGFDQLDVHGKQQSSDNILRLIASIPPDQDFVVSAYCEKLARMFSSAPQQILKKVQQLRSALSKGNPEPVLSPLQQHQNEHRHEQEFIRALILYGSLEYEPGICCYYYMMSRAGLPQDFINPVTRLIFQSYYQLLEQQQVPTLDTFLQHPDPEVVDFAMDLSLGPQKISDCWHSHGAIPQQQHQEVVRKITAYFRIAKIREKICELKKDMAQTKDSALLEGFFLRDSELKKILIKECASIGIKAF